MGVELEGAWTRGRRANIAASVLGAKPIDDASVHLSQGDPGEIVTRPHSSMEDLCKDIQILYPDVLNESCGFHIHTSFTPLDASVIASSDFFSYFKEQWAQWGRDEKVPKNHEFWQRLAGNNQHARDSFEAEKQLSTSFAGQKRQARYTMLNFYAWEKHRTIENRVLPMFSDQKFALSAVRHMAFIYDSYLAEHGFQPLKFESAVVLEGEAVVERYEQPTPDTTPTFTEARGFFPRLVTGADVFYHIPGAMDKVLPYNKDTGDYIP